LGIIANMFGNVFVCVCLVNVFFCVSC